MVTVPPFVFRGIVTTTTIEQECAGDPPARDPPVKVITWVPVPVTTPPQVLPVRKVNTNPVPVVARLSIKPRLVKAVAPTGLVNVIVNVLVPPATIWLFPLTPVKALVLVGKTFVTVIGAVAAAAFVPPCVVVNLPTGIVLVPLPTAVPTTVTVILQLPLAGIVPSVRVTERAPVETTPPAHDVVAPGIAAIETKEFVGALKSSSKVFTVKGSGEGLVIVIVRVLAPPKGIEFGANALAMESPVTPRVDDTGWSFVAPCAVVIRPAGMVFV